jgi:hypothetical protein
MAYIKCRGCGLCVKCIVTNYCKHTYVNDLGGVYTYGVLVLGGTWFSGDDCCSSVMSVMS